MVVFDLFFLKPSNSPFNSGFCFKLEVVRRVVDGSLFTISVPSETRKKRIIPLDPIPVYDFRMIGESGRFEKLISSMRSPTLIAFSDQIVACGLRIFVDSILALLVDFVYGVRDHTTFANSDLIASASIPDVIVYSYNSYPQEDASVLFELDKHVAEVLGILREAGLRCSVGRHELHAKLLTNTSRRAVLKLINRKKETRVQDCDGIDQNVLQFLASITSQTNVSTILVVHNSPKEFRKLSIKGCYLRKLILDDTLQQSEFEPFLYTSLILSEVLAFSRRQLPIRRAMIFGDEAGSEQVEAEHLPAPGEDYHKKIEDKIKDFVFFADKVASSGKSKIKEQRHLVDKIKLNFMETFHGFGSLTASPIIIATELPLTEIRDLGTFLIKLGTPSASQLLGQGSSPLRQGSGDDRDANFFDDIEIYVNFRPQFRKAVRNLLSEIHRLFSSHNSVPRERKHQGSDSFRF